jgi:transglutaminase-like putative cysteine protease
MRIRVGYDLVYECPAPAPMMLMLSVRPERLPDLVTPQVMSLEPKVPAREYVDSFGNICTRLIAPPGPLRLSADFVIADSGLPDAVEPAAVQHDIDTLPDETLVFLMPSRYCEADRLSDEAWRLFGSVAPGWARVQAIVDFVHDRITFGYPHARPTRSAFEGLKEQVGVCRDFAHLAVTLCRCMNIPARYCTGYLGDIGVPYGGPMDFSAWFEVYLGGCWYTFDARHNTPRVGRIAMAYGRDAADTAISTNFGPAALTRFEVIAEEVA